MRSSNIFGFKYSCLNTRCTSCVNSMKSSIQSFYPERIMTQDTNKTAENNSNRNNRSNFFSFERIRVLLLVILACWFLVPSSWYLGTPKVETIIQDDEIQRYDNLPLELCRSIELLKKIGVSEKVTENLDFVLSNGKLLDTSKTSNVYGNKAKQRWQYDHELDEIRYPRAELEPIYEISNALFLYEEIEHRIYCLEIFGGEIKYYNQIAEMELDAGEKKIKLLEKLRSQIQQMSERETAWKDYQSIYVDNEIASNERYIAFFQTRVAFFDSLKLLNDMPGGPPSEPEIVRLTQKLAKQNHYMLFNYKDYFDLSRSLSNLKSAAIQEQAEVLKTRADDFQEAKKAHKVKAEKAQEAIHAFYD